MIGPDALHPSMAAELVLMLMRSIRSANSILMLERAFDQRTTSKAIFAPADYQLTDKLTETVGLRYTDGKESGPI